MQCNKTRKDIRYVYSRATREIYKVLILNEDEEIYKIKDFDRYRSVHFAYRINIFFEKKYAFLYKELTYSKYYK